MAVKIEEELKSRFANDYQKGVVNIFFTYNQVHAILNTHFKKFGIATSQFNVLRILRGQFPQAASIGLIKDRMMEKNSDASRVVDRLVKKNLVLRKECPQDRRQKEVLISDKGLQLLSEMDKLADAEEDLLTNLSEKEIEQLNYLLDKVREGLPK